MEAARAIFAGMRGYLKGVNMRKVYAWTTRALLAGCSGGILLVGTGSCLADNFWSGVLGDTVINGAIAAAVAKVLAGVGL